MRYSVVGTPGFPRLPPGTQLLSWLLTTHLAPAPLSTLPQVKVQTVPGFARGLADGLPKFVAQEGVAGLFKGITPLWGRQIPYTMMKFGASGRGQGA